MFFISDIIDEDNVIVSRNHAGADAVPISISELYECTGFIPVVGMHDNIIFCMKERVFAYQDRITAHFYGKAELSYIGGGRYRAENCFLLDKLQVIKWGNRIVLPDYVKSINGNFMNDYYLSRLKSIKADGVYRLEISAFAGATGLKEVSFKNLKEILQCVFLGCTALEEFVSGDDLCYIGMEAFKNCKSLKRVELGGYIHNVGARAFSCCDGLEEVVIKSDTAKFAGDVFAGCLGLKKIILPKRVSLACTGINEDKVKIIRI